MPDSEPVRTGRIKLGRNTGLLAAATLGVEVTPAAAESVIAGPDKSVVIEAPFPEARLLRWTPEREHGEAAPENDIALVVTQEVIAEVARHLSRTLDRELGGFLLGNLYRCPNSGRKYLVIDQSSRAQFTQSSDVHLAFTLDSWAYLAEEMTGKFLGKLVVGWYHSHPRMDVFLSAYDVAIHEERFADLWTTALVVEPEKNRGGFFRWQDGKLNPRAPFQFYELIARGAGDSVVEWTNYVLAGGHRPETEEIRRRPFGSGALVRGSRPLALDASSDFEDSRFRFSPTFLVLAGMLLGVLMSIGLWFVLAGVAATEAAPQTAEPVPAAIEPLSETPAAPEAVAPAAEPRKPPKPAVSPRRRKPAPSSKPGSKATDAGA